MHVMQITDSINSQNIDIWLTTLVWRWHAGAAGRALDLQSIGHGFKSYSGQRCYTATVIPQIKTCPLPGRQVHCYTALPRVGFEPVTYWLQVQRWCSVAGKVTAGLAESSGILPPGGWLTVTCGLTACTPGSAPGPTLGIEYGKAFYLPILSLIHIWRCRRSTLCRSRWSPYH